MSSVSIDYMRSILCKQYGGAWKWVNKVRSMSDMQVLAVYRRMQSANQLST